MRRAKLGKTIWFESERDMGLFWGSNELKNISHPWYELKKMGAKLISTLKTFTDLKEREK